MENKDGPLDQQIFDKADLLLRYYRGELSTTESEKLEQWLAQDEANKKFAESLQDEVFRQDPLDFFSSIDSDAAWQKVSSRIEQPKPETSFWRNAAYFKYAAVFLILCVTGLLAYKYQSFSQENSRKLASKDKVTPKMPIPAAGGNQAQLVLANGTVIPLQHKATGIIWNKNGLRVTQQGAALHFSFLRGNRQTIVGNTTLTTPIGSQYKITLPDGSQVWLNASSGLTFSNLFERKNREVTLSGEGYFEVTKNKNMPFRVKANGTVVEVLGTHFNVMAYPEEQSTNTTLLEGAVKIHHNNHQTIIKPGYQAKAGATIAVEKVDVAIAVAWKKGLFHFQNTELEIIMRQLERWYGVEFINTGRLQNAHFTGIISRNTEFAKVLKMLELSGDIKFKTEGKKVVIQPNKI